ncbi:MAG TPA: NFACT family protein [Pyrinomonadaceae bacterium]|jgi:predicted ribosome quality control (RQC) complex YloA/Tae2 family protein|nr:NFACT family protein [Pyrinomonadaceae bacterium]
MNDRLLALIVEELAAELRGRALGKVWQLSRPALAADFRGGGGRTLFVSVDPSMPRLYLSSQKLRELEKQSLPPSNFVLTLRKRLAGAPLRSVAKDEGERVVRFAFETWDEAGAAGESTLVAQLTGRSSNLLLLDEGGHIVDALRPPRGAGQEIGEAYQPPPRSSAERAPDEHAGGSSPDEAAATIPRGSFPTLSAALEANYLRLGDARDFDARVSSLRARLRQEIERRRKLERNLEKDSLAHGDAEEHRRAGDLLLANLSTAERAGSRVRLTDYFAEGAPTVELEIDENATLQEEAARRFARYSRAKRAAQEITRRREELRAELSALEARREELERASAERDAGALAAFESKQPKAKGAGHGGTAQGVASHDGAREKKTKKRGDGESSARVRRYRSSDGYEILVGRAARDNDELTFRVARSHDLWLHAADYPGSHVVVRARGRDDEVPHRTLVEAAQLAAHFSQAKRDAKVAVHHTRRKFVSKMKGAAPGLVRLASFRTILVEPREAVERI